MEHVSLFGEILIKDYLPVPKKLYCIILAEIITYCWSHKQITRPKFYFMEGFMGAKFLPTYETEDI